MKRASLGLALALVASIVSVVTAANIVPETKADQLTSVTDANALKPDECAALNLTAVVLADTGTAASELILGTAAVNNQDGGGGDDCLLGGAGNDTLSGGPGTDVCIGGPDNDTYDATCETQV